MRTPSKSRRIEGKQSLESYALPTLSPRTDSTDGLLSALPVEHHNRKARRAATLVVSPIACSRIDVDHSHLRIVDAVFCVAVRNTVE